MDNDSDNYPHGFSSPSQHDFNFLLCKQHNYSDSIIFKKEAFVL